MGAGEGKGGEDEGLQATPLLCLSVPAAGANDGQEEEEEEEEDGVGV